MADVPNDPFVFRTQCASPDGDFEWIALTNPDHEALQHFAKELNVPKLYVEDISNQTERAKIESSDDDIFVILKPVQIDPKTQKLQLSQWAVYITEDYLLTVTYGANELMASIQSNIANTDDKKTLEHAQLTILHHCADVIADEYMQVLDVIHGEAINVESSVFAKRDKDGSTRNHTERIYQLKRQVSAFRQVVVPLSYTMHRLTMSNAHAWGNRDRYSALAPYFRDVYDHVLQTSDSLETIDRLLSDVLQADLALISMQQSDLAIRQNEVAEDQNDVARQISAWVAIGGVPTVLAGIFGMNFVNMPPLKQEYGFYTMLIGTAILCGILYVAFRRQKWL